MECRGRKVMLYHLAGVWEDQGKTINRVVLVRIGMARCSLGPSKLKHQGNISRPSLAIGQMTVRTLVMW